MANETFQGRDGIEYTRPHQPFDPEHPGNFPVFAETQPGSGIGHFEPGSYKKWDTPQHLEQIMTGVSSEQAAAEHAAKVARWAEAEGDLAERTLSAANVERPAEAEPHQPAPPAVPEQ